MNSKWLVLALPKSLLLAAGSLGCFEVAPDPRQFTAWQLKAALKWALVSSGCYKSPRFRARCMDGDCVLLLSHKGTATREPEPFNGAFRGTHRTTFCRPFLSSLPRYTCIIWTAGCSRVQCGFELELIRALTCTPWTNRCSQLPANSRLGNLYGEQAFGNRLSWWQRDPLLTQSWGLHLVSESKVGTDTLFVSRNSSTVQHSSPGRAQRHPQSSVWEDSSHSAQGHLSGTPSIATTWFGMPSPAVLSSKAYQEKELCMYPRILTLISWLFCPPPFGVFPPQNQGMSCRLRDCALLQALPLPRLDVNAKVKYNPPTQTRC